MIFNAILQVLWIIAQACEKAVEWLGITGNWYYVFIAGFILWAVFHYCGRLKFYLLLASVAGFVVLLGIALLSSLDLTAICSIKDFFFFVLLLVAFIAIIVIGGRLMRLFNGKVKEQWDFENWVDRFHDAWNSRNDR